jgi:hypothetical protein
MPNTGERQRSGWCPRAARRLHTLREFDLALTEFDGKQRLYGASYLPAHRISLLMRQPLYP